MKDPDSVTLLIWLVVVAVPAILFIVVERCLPKRNRWTRDGWRKTPSKPFDDDRCSIRNFKRIHTR